MLFEVESQHDGAAFGFDGVEEVGYDHRHTNRNPGNSRLNPFKNISLLSWSTVTESGQDSPNKSLNTRTFYFSQSLNSQNMLVKAKSELLFD